MSLWLTTTDHSERLDGTDLTISWHPAGFGWWIVQCFRGPEKLTQFSRTDFDTARTLARDACEVAVGEVA